MPIYPRLNAAFPVLKVGIATEHDLKLAAALGHFAQVCGHIEGALERAISNLLPMTISMSRVALSGGQFRSNIGILRAVSKLGEVSITQAQRDFIEALCVKLVQISEDRNRLLHNRIIEGPEGAYTLIQNRRDADGDASVAMPITIDEIQQRSVLAMDALAELSAIPVIDYDLSTWGRDSPRYRLKPFPGTTRSRPRPNTERS